MRNTSDGQLWMLHPAWVAALSRMRRVALWVGYLTNQGPAYAVDDVARAMWAGGHYDDVIVERGDDGHVLRRRFPDLLVARDADDPQAGAPVDGEIYALLTDPHPFRVGQLQVAMEYLIGMALLDDHAQQQRIEARHARRLAAYSNGRASAATRQLVAAVASERL